MFGVRCFYIGVFSVLCIFLVSTQDCFADCSYTVSAVIPAVSTVIVDKQGIIQKILCNSKRPQAVIVRENSLSGKALSYDANIAAQYNNITNYGHSLHVGVVYFASQKTFQQQLSVTVGVKLISSISRLNYRSFATVRTEPVTLFSGI